jgi:hypothetical protein
MEDRMGKGGSISIGADTPTGQPRNAPAGPYTTEEHDDEMAAADKVSSQDATRTGPAGSRTETKIAEQSELGSDNAGGETSQDAPHRSTRTQKPDMPDEIAKRPKGPAQP